MLLLIHGSLEVLVAAQTCWLSFSSLGSLLSSVNMDRSLEALWTALQKKNVQAPASLQQHLEGLSVCAVEGALGLGLWFQSLPSGVEICMLIPACRS